MDNLSVTPEELRNSASEMKIKVNNMKTSLETATGVINRTSESFKGSSADELREKYNSLSQKFDDFYTAMTNYANFLDKIANTYDETNEAIKKAAEETLISEYNN